MLGFYEVSSHPIARQDVDHVKAIIELVIAGIEAKV
jgi:hypothetical protein